MSKKSLVLSLLVAMSGNLTSAAIPPWSTEVHHQLIVQAFPNDLQICKAKMIAGSDWVDSFSNQMPSKSYMHAMRSDEDQSIEETRTIMANLIQNSYEFAAELRASSTEDHQATPADPTILVAPTGEWIVNLENYLQHCYQRGVALHPVADSTSPAHANFAIWSLTDIKQMLEHGDLPGSIENERALLEHPDIKKKTIGLMRIIDFLYLKLGRKEFRYDY